MKKGVVCQGKGVPKTAGLNQLSFPKMADCGFQEGQPEKRGVGKANRNKKGPFSAGHYGFKVLFE
jgi:hypothetical protein